MCHRRLWRRASVWLALALALPGVATADRGDPRPAAASRGETLVLAVTVDGRAQPEPVAVRREGGEVVMHAADLRALGIATGPDGGDVRLATLPGLRFVIDEGAQTIAIRTDRVRGLSAGGIAGDPPVPLSANGWGGFVNYDASVYAGGGARYAGATVEGVVFTPRGHVFAGAIASAGGGGAARLVRTDIGYSLTLPDRVLRLTVGDVINAASSTSRPVRMAGLRIGTDFAIRPDLVTFPLPTVAGAAAVPSAVDLIVNGDRHPVGEVGAGRFSVSEVPVQTGVNTVAVAVRDPLGRATLQTVTVYASRDLLRPGLSAFSAEAGWVRTGYLSGDDRYRDLVASGTWRRGLSERVTLEAHGEGAARVATGSLGAVVNLGSLGIASGTAGVGRGERAEVTAQWSIGLQRIARPVSVSLRYLRNGAGWHDLAADHGAATPAHSALATIGFDLARYGTVSLTAIDVGRGRMPRDGWAAGRTGIGGPTPASTLFDATWSVKLNGRVGLLATIGMDARRRRSTFASLGAVMVFGARTNGYAGASRSTGATVASATITRAAVEQGDWGYRAEAAAGPVDHAGVAVRHLGRAGLVEAAAAITGAGFAAQVTARGSIVRVGGRSFLAETMTDSFAVVDTAGQGKVAIYRDHHRVGVTDGHGLLVVPNLAAYQPTGFSIDPTAIDPALAIGRVDAMVRPGERVGVPVRFDLAVDRSVLFTLVDASGEPLPAGARGRVGGIDVPVGFDGQVYLDPRQGGEMIVTLPDRRRCAVQLPPRRAITGSTLRAVCRPMTATRS